MCMGTAPARFAGAVSVSKKLAYGDLFRQVCAVFLSPLRGSRAGNGVRKPCYARLPNPPHMSLDSEYSSEGCGPPNLPKGFFDSLTAPARFAGAVCFYRIVQKDSYTNVSLIFSNSSRLMSTSRGLLPTDLLTMPRAAMSSIRRPARA